MIGLNTNFGISCDKCSAGIDLQTAIKINNAKFLDDFFTCNCGRKFTYIEGIINEFCSDSMFSEYEFISNIQMSGRTEIVIGKTAIVYLDSDCWINKIHINQNGLWVKGIPNGSNSFKIISSEIENSKDSTWNYPKIGSKKTISWTVYGKTEDAKIEIWNIFLIKAKEQIIKQDFLLAFFSTAVALESFLNLRFFEILEGQHVHGDAIDIFLKESYFSDKIFKLSKSLLGIEYEKSEKKDLQRLIETRNKIAHGKTTDITGEEAKVCFKVVVSVIFKNHLLDKTKNSKQLHF